MRRSIHVSYEEEDTYEERKSEIESQINCVI
jgi:hypothetical protein